MGAGRVRLAGAWSLRGLLFCLTAQHPVNASPLNVPPKTLKLSQPENTRAFCFASHFSDACAPPWQCSKTVRLFFPRWPHHWRTLFAGRERLQQGGTLRGEAKIHTGNTCTVRKSKAGEH